MNSYPYPASLFGCPLVLNFYEATTTPPLPTGMPDATWMDGETSSWTFFDGLRGRAVASREHLLFGPDPLYKLAHAWLRSLPIHLVGHLSPAQQAAREAVTAEEVWEATLPLRKAIARERGAGARMAVSA